MSTAHVDEPARPSSTADSSSATDPSLVRFIDPDGSAATSEAPLIDEYTAIADALTDQNRLDLYRRMTVWRRLDNEIAALQRQGQLGMWVQSLGQEGAQAGAALALRSQDWLYPSYREHLMVLQRGVDIGDLLSLFRGVTHGVWDWKGTRTQQYTLVIGSQTLHGTGFAHGVALDGLVGTGDPSTDTAVMTCFGDGATSEGDVSEAMVFAASQHVPEVFFCQNNHWAISVPTRVQAHAPLYKRAAGFGIPSVYVDGNDVLATYAVSRYWLDRARSGAGPAFVEAATYRMGAHTTSDEPSKYRAQDEVDAWAAFDPIARYRTWLGNEQGVADDFFDEVDADGDAQAAQVRARIQALPDPDVASMFTNIYSAPHPLVAEEAAWATSYEQAMDEEAQR